MPPNHAPLANLLLGPDPFEDPLGPYVRALAREVFTSILHLCHELKLPPLTLHFYSHRGTKSAYGCACACARANRFRHVF
jgi:hypothetical protein